MAILQPPVITTDELDLDGRKYTVLATMTMLAVPLLVFWAALITLAFTEMHSHPGSLVIK